MAKTATTETTCPLCEGTGWTLIEEEGVELVRRCECAEGRTRQRLLEQAGIPARYRHCTLDSFELWNPEDPTLAKTLRAVQEFVDLYPADDKGLLLMGSVAPARLISRLPPFNRSCAKRRRRCGVDLPTSRPSSWRFK